MVRVFLFHFHLYTFFQYSIKGADVKQIKDLAIPLSEWSGVELGLGLVASCAATLRPLLRTLELPKFLKPKPSHDNEMPAPPSFTSKRKKRDPLQLKTITVEGVSERPEEVAVSYHIEDIVPGPQLNYRQKEDV